MRRPLPLLVLIVVVLQGATTAAEPRYRVTAIGAGEAGRFVFARDVNDAGYVVGDVTTPSGDRAYVWHADMGLRHLGTLGGERAMTTAQAISGEGRIVGSSRTDRPFGPDHAFLRDPDQSRLRDLGDLGDGSDYSRARGVNDAGTVVGTAWDPDAGAYQAFLWRADTGMQRLPAAPAAQSHATAVNARGQVAGYTVAGNTPGRAFVWTPGERTVFMAALRPADTDIIATAMNDAGVVVGRSGAGARHEAFLWRPGDAPVGLGHLDPAAPYAEARDINSAGTVVGRSLRGDAMGAFVRYPGAPLRALDTLLCGADTVHLISAEGIADDGRIAAFGRRDGERRIRAFLLTPQGTAEPD